MLLLPLTAVLLAGCGSSAKKNAAGGPKTQKLADDTSSATSAQTLLRETIDGQHKLTSGNLSLTVALTPSGSAMITDPIKLSVSGPFQSEGAGKLPTLDLTISGSAQGQNGTLELISTGGKAYITVDGQSYGVPAATVQNLEAQLASNASGQAQAKQAGSQLLAKLGIDATDWFSDPTVVGTETVDGAATTHIHSTLSVSAVIDDIDKILGSLAPKSSAATSAMSGLIPSKIPAADAAKIEQELGSPSIDLWTADSDKIIRRLRVSLDVPISGSVSSQLGGLKSVGVAIGYDVSDVNQPQTVTAPTSVQPFAQFETKIKTLVQSAAGNLLGGSLLNVTGTGASGTMSSSGSALTKKYTNCIQKAGSDTAQLQKCTTLLTSP